jgi:hypothetical protein
VRAGTLRGPVLDVVCDVAADDTRLVAARPRTPVVRYRCVAVSFRARAAGRTMLAGAPFVARVHFAERRYAWCAFTPVGGEGTHTASTFRVPPPRDCVAGPQT